jgi:hypothetical protein
MKFLIAALLSTCPLAAANVLVWQDTLNLLTWSEGPPDTNPRFELYARGDYPSYPYAFPPTSFRTTRTSPGVN